MQLAALMRTQVNVRRPTVGAVLTRRRDHVARAALLDPHTAAELDTAQIAKLVDDLLDAHGSFIPETLPRRESRLRETP